MKARGLLWFGLWLFFVVAATWFVMRAVRYRAAMERQVSEAKAQAKEAVDRLQARLQEKLMAAMAEGGPAAAVEVCAEAAQPLSDDLRGETGFWVSRSALRTRNPDNAPGPFEAEWMTKVASQTTAATPIEPATKVEEFIDGDRLLHYWRPIYLGARCLACHGAPEQIAPEVAALLTERYPQDAATGFAEGDFRGVFVARVPLPKLEG